MYVDGWRVIGAAIILDPFASPFLGTIPTPQGPIMHHGRMHMFYQCNPYGVVWGNMSWCHVQTQDGSLTRWSRAPIALTPGAESYDHLGVFSGSTTIDTDGTPVIMYTGFSSARQQLQCTAVPTNSSLIAWQRTAGNPVLPHPQVGHGDDNNFRDPTTAWQVGQASGTNWTIATGLQLLGFTGVRLPWFQLPGGCPFCSQRAEHTAWYATGVVSMHVAPAAAPGIASPAWHSPGHWSSGGVLWADPAADVMQSSHASGRNVALECPDVVPAEQVPGTEALTQRCPAGTALMLLKYSVQGVPSMRGMAFHDFFMLGCLNASHAGSVQAPSFEPLHPPQPVDHGQVYASKSYGAQWRWDPANVSMPWRAQPGTGWEGSPTLGERDRVMWGWVRPTSPLHPGLPWAGALTLPRLLRFDPGLQTLIATPAVPSPCSAGGVCEHSGPVHVPAGATVDLPSTAGAVTQAHLHGNISWASTRGVFTPITLRGPASAGEQPPWSLRLVQQPAIGHLPGADLGTPTYRWAPLNQSMYRNNATAAVDACLQLCKADSASCAAWTVTSQDVPDMPADLLRCELKKWWPLEPSQITTCPAGTAMCVSGGIANVWVAVLQVAGSAESAAPQDMGGVLLWPHGDPAQSTQHTLEVSIFRDGALWEMYLAGGRWRCTHTWLPQASPSCGAWSIQAPALDLTWSGAVGVPGSIWE